MTYYNASLSHPHTMNVAQARKLIAQSGLKTPIHITVDVEAGDEAGAVIGPIIKDYWAQVGVDLTLQTLSAPVYVSTTETGKDQAYIRTAGPGVPTPDYYLGYSMLCGISFNLTRMCVPSLDALYKQAIAAPPSDQQSYWNRVTTMWRNFSPRVQFFGEKFPIILNKKVHNYEFSDESTMQQYWGF
jgi:ABC-type transport system substrate-binding protein